MAYLWGRGLIPSHGIDPFLCILLRGHRSLSHFSLGRGFPKPHASMLPAAALGSAQSAENALNSYRKIPQNYPEFILSFCNDLSWFKHQKYLKTNLFKYWNSPLNFNFHTFFDFSLFCPKMLQFTTQRLIFCFEHFLSISNIQTY